MIIGIVLILYLFYLNTYLCLSFLSYFPNFCPSFLLSFVPSFVLMFSLLYLFSPFLPYSPASSLFPVTWQSSRLKANTRFLWDRQSDISFHAVAQGSVSHSHLPSASDLSSRHPETASVTVFNRREGCSSACPETLMLRGETCKMLHISSQLDHYIFSFLIPLNCPDWQFKWWHKILILRVIDTVY